MASGTRPEKVLVIGPDNAGLLTSRDKNVIVWPIDKEHSSLPVPRGVKILWYASTLPEPWRLRLQTVAARRNIQTWPGMSMFQLGARLSPYWDSDSYRNIYLPVTHAGAARSLQDSEEMTALERRRRMLIDANRRYRNIAKLRRRREQRRFAEN